MMGSDISTIGIMKICTICGCKFYTSNPDEYTYKLLINGKVKWYCRYNHWRIDQKQIEANAKYDRRV